MKKYEKSTKKYGKSMWKVRKSKQKVSEIQYVQFMGTNTNNSNDKSKSDFLYIIGAVCLSVTKNDHFAQGSQIKFFSGSNLFF